MIVFNKASIRLALVGYDLTDSQLGAARKKMAFFVPIGCVRFARYCCKMHSRHLFPYGGLSFSDFMADICRAFFHLYSIFFSIIGDLQVCNLLFTRKKTIVVIGQLRI